jgi:hypothetical protein
LNRYLLSLMNEVRDRVQDAKLFTKIDQKLRIILSESALVMNGRHLSEPGMDTMSM